MDYEKGGTRPPKDEFEEFLIRIHDFYGAELFPNMAVWEVPKALEEKTKKSLFKLGVEEAGRILVDAITDINLGSMETLDHLVKKRL